MHVLYFHQHFSTPAGATGTRSYEMARELVARGHQVTMVCGSTSHGCTQLDSRPVRGVRRGDVDGIHVVEICLPYSNHDGFGKRSLTFLRYAVRSVAIAATTKYDLLFATSTPLTAALPGIVMRLVKPGRPFVFEVRDLWPELPRAMGVIRNSLVLAAMSVLERLAYRCAHACIGLSPGIVAGIRRRSPRDKAVALVPNGADVTKFHPPDNRCCPGVKKKFRAVFSGAHGIANGLDAVLDAAAVLKERNRNDVELVFIGDGKLKPQLIARAQREGLHNCRFLKPVSKTALARLIADSDAGLMILANVAAFYYGTSPNKFFDYISTGLPVINNYPGWLADLIGEHGCGISVPPDDPEALADALARLADSPPLRRTMGRNARRLAEQHFNRRMLASQFAELIENVADYKPAEGNASATNQAERFRKAA